MYGREGINSENLSKIHTTASFNVMYKTEMLNFFSYVRMY